MEWLPLLLNITFTVAFLWAVVAIMTRRRRARLAEDGPESEPYRVYTRAYDRVLTLSELPSGLYEASPDGEKGFLEPNDRQWRAQIGDAERIYEALGDAPPLSEGQETALYDTAVLLLVDQSGSMRGERMAWVAAGMRRLVEELSRRGSKVALAGYTTAGWHGGFARKQWHREGERARPGRLCALMHILYRPFDSATFDVDGWRQMLNPDILRENVDGESLEWGAALLRERAEKRRMLFVVSDGAPVDDSTLLNNGPSYMHRHFLEVRDRLLAAGDVELMAFGADYRVADYYPASRKGSDAADLVGAGLSLVLKS
jgi:cobaltochelatase CobT